MCRARRYHPCRGPDILRREESGMYPEIILRTCFGSSAGAGVRIPGAREQALRSAAGSGKMRPLPEIPEHGASLQDRVCARPGPFRQIGEHPGTSLLTRMSRTEDDSCKRPVPHLVPASHSLFSNGERGKFIRNPAASRQHQIRHRLAGQRGDAESDLETAVGDITAGPAGIGAQ